MAGNLVISYELERRFNRFLAIFIAELPETTANIHKQEAINYYNSFVPQEGTAKKK